MSRYIDIENFCENFCHCNNEYCDKSNCPILNAPTADVAEVKHGEWLKHYQSGVTVSEGFVSSCCDMWNERKTPYCPNCGARMDGGDFDEMPNIKSQE